MPESNREHQPANRPGGGDRGEVPADRCAATKADGEPCRAFAQKGRETCKAHAQADNFGRRKLLNDPAVLDAIEKALSGGAYRKDAAAYAGIGTSTFYRWLEVGEAQAENGEAGRERVFWETVTRAEAVAKVRLCGLISARAKDDWRAAAWMLERKHPHQYGRRQRVELEGSVHTGGSGSDMDLRKLTDDELEQLERLHERAAE